jgi:phenylacetate-CoA ligase
MLQFSKLQAMLLRILPGNRFYARKFREAGIDPARLESLDELESLPFTTKQELVDDQAANPPYGSNLSYPLRQYFRLHQTSGTKGKPLRWLDSRENWDWFMQCWRMKYDFIGLKPEDRLFFPFSFGPFIGFWAAFEAGCRQGNLCLAAGGMSSSARLRFMIENQATIVCCTPTYALRLAEVAQLEEIDLRASSVRILIVAGEPGGSIPATRQRIEQEWGARVVDHWGMTELGSLAIEHSAFPGGMYLLETECVAEVVDPASGAPLPPGKEGELVVTNLGRWVSPLIRYRTGDRVVIDPQPPPAGPVFLRLQGGILGRTDDMWIIRGNNVYPSAIENILRRFVDIQEFRLEVDDSQALVSLRILIEVSGSGDPSNAVRETIRRELHFRPDVVVVPVGTLPRSEMKAQRVVRKM